MLLYSYVKIFQWENLPTCEIFNNIICIICHIVFRRDIGEYIEGIHANRLSSCDIRLGIIADKQTPVNIKSISLNQYIEKPLIRLLGLIIGRD